MSSIFISCVSDEFDNYRDAIRRDLTRPNVDTKIQEDFIAFGGATLEKLDAYIQHCEAVIHIVGDMTGSMANELSVQYINNKYPDFVKRFPVLQPVLEGKAGLSYTQWEAYLAAYHGKRIFVAVPSEKVVRSERYKKEDAQTTLQLAHLNNLRALGYYDEIHFAMEDELVKKLYQSKLGDILNSIPKIKPVNLPYKSLGDAFKGREDFMNDLHKTFSSAANNGMAIAVHGLGGMGKTRLAVEYAWKQQDEYTALLFITVASPELLKTNIANLSDTRILNLPEHEAKEEDVKYSAVINWLNQYSRWLLILDNVDTKEAAIKAEELYAQFQHGHVLITTRIDSWSKQVKKKELGVLSKEAAAAFLLETTANEREKTNNDNELAAAITRDLGYLALALEQARAYIVTKELSFEKYRKNWDKSRADVLSWYDKQQMQYPASVAITWQTSFDQLSIDATILLNRLAWLAPEPIPKSLLEVELQDKENTDTQSGWEKLKQYSLATSSEDKKTFIIHKLVLDVTKNKMDEALKLKTLIEALNWIDNAFIDDPTDATNWPQLEPLLPHLLSSIEYARENEINDPTSRLMNQAGLLFLYKAKYEAAEPLITKALQINEGTLGKNHPDVAVQLNNLAQIFQATNRITAAEPLMRKALRINEQSLGKTHPDVAIDLNNLALLLKDTNRLKEAEPLMRRALKIDEQNLGTNHPNTARDLNNLALILKASNRLKKAETLMRKALAIDELTSGDNHPNVARDLNNLGELLLGTNRWQEAEPLIRRALAIDERNLGASHPDVARDLNNLAQFLQRAELFEEAEPLMKRALDIHEQTFGANHPLVALVLNNLGRLFQDTNRLDKAEPLMRKSFMIFFKSLGVDHPNTDAALDNYALLLEEMGKTQDEIKDFISKLINEE